MLLPGRKTGFGDLRVEGGKIAEITLRDEVAAHQGGLLIMPGLVNCHGHTAMTLLRGVGGGLPLQQWLEEAIFPLEAKMTPSDIRAGVAWGAMEMLAGGTTTIADMYDFPQDGADVFTEVGMKANVCRVGLNFVEGRLAECVDFVREFKCGRVLADVCIHSEYLTDEGFCRELALANRELKRPLHVHVSETRREHEQCIARHGMTPMAYLAKTGLLDYGAYAAHCVWCSDDDFKIMRELGVTLVHNPTSNLKLGSGFARIPEAIAAGVSVALGTDGCASNNNLDMFEEMHLSSLIHKGRLNDPTALSAWDVIEMATVNGARALGRSNCAELAVGNAADLCVVDLDKPHLSPVTDVAELVVSSMQASDVVMTMVDGEVLYDRGQWPTINDERAEYDFKCAVRRLLN